MRAVIVSPAFDADVESVDRYAARAEIARLFAVEVPGLTAECSTERYELFRRGKLSAYDYYRGNVPPAEMLDAWRAITARPGSAVPSC